jgi:CelD/BcsL family acetyltransferase involved in cellulose biosynthesis
MQTRGLVESEGARATHGDRASFDLYTDPQNWRAPEVLAAWEKCLADCHSPDRIQASPAWFEVSRANRPRQGCALAYLRDSCGVPEGVAPLVIGNGGLVFGVGSVTLKRLRFPVAHFLGNEPLLPEDGPLHDRLISGTFDALPEVEALALNLPRDSFCWRHLQTSRTVRARWICHVSSENRANYLDLPESFDQYAKRFSSKRRANLTRLVNRAELRIWRATAPSEVPEFLRASSAIARRSWQRADPSLPAHTAEWASYLMGLAGHRLLRGYVLYRGDAACSYILGYQFGDEYHYSLIGYDPQFASLSPGTVLLYHAIRDLIDGGGPRRIERGIGNFAYKRDFGNAQRAMVGVLLLRKTPRNWVSCLTHRSFRSLVKAARWGLRRPPP